MKTRIQSSDSILKGNVSNLIESFDIIISGHFCIDLYS